MRARLRTSIVGRVTSHDRLWRLAGLALFVFAVSRIDVGQTVQRLTRAAPEFLLLAGLATVPLLAVRAWRLHVILAGFGVDLPFRDILKLRIVASAAGDATPGRVGEISAVAYLSRYGQSVATATAALIVDRILDGAVFVLAAIAALPSFGLRTAVLGWSATAIAPVATVRNSAIWNQVSGDPKSTVRYAGAAGGLSVLAFTILVSRAYCLVLALDIPISFFDLAGVVAISTFVQLLPISVLGIGSRDVSLLYLFGRLGLPADSAISLSWLVLGMLVLQMVFGLAVWWRYPLRLGDEPSVGGEQRAVTVS